MLLLDFIFYKISSIYLKSLLSFLIASVIFSFNATLIEHALEIRPYAVLPTLSMAVFLVFHKMVNFKGEESLLQRIALILFFCFVIIFHPYGILIVCFCFLYFFVRKVSFRNLVQDVHRLLQYVIPVGTLCLPVYYLSHFKTASRGQDVFSYIPNPLDNLIGFLKGIIGNLVGIKVLYFLLIPLLFCLDG